MTFDQLIEQTGAGSTPADLIGAVPGVSVEFHPRQRRGDRSSPDVPLGRGPDSSSSRMRISVPEPGK
jgi:hypothetical protein